MQTDESPVDTNWSASGDNPDPAALSLDGAPHRSQIDPVRHTFSIYCIVLIYQMHSRKELRCSHSQLVAFTSARAGIYLQIRVRVCAI